MWFTELIDKLLCFIPRPFLIAPDEAGYRASPRLFGGMKVKSLGPGCYIWLPLLQKAEKVQVKTQVVDLRAQSVWTSDGQNVTVSGAIRYRITNAVKALLDVLDFDKNIQTVGLAVIHNYTNRHTLDQCRVNVEELQQLILKQIRDESQGWGLKIESAYITDTGDTINIRILTNV